jgi:hypothetical protein
MKRMIRISVLMCGLVGTYVAAAIPQGPALDGGPIPLCPPTIHQVLQGSNGGSTPSCKPVLF